MCFDPNEKLLHIGLSTIGELVGWAMTDRYPPRNGRTSKALYALGYDVTIHNHINRRGDAMAESRGGREDRLLKDSYEGVFNRGAWMQRSEFFQSALTSRQLKV